MKILLVQDLSVKLELVLAFSKEQPHSIQLHCDGK